MQSDEKSKATSTKEELDKALRFCYRLELTKAEAELSGIIRKDPAADDAYSALALIKLMQGKPDQQREILESALNRNPTHYASNHQLSVALFRGGQFDTAHASIRRALTQNPRSVSSLLLASRLCLLLHDAREAYQLAGQALKERKGWLPEASNLMADALIQSSDLPSELCERLFEELAAEKGDVVKLNAATNLILSLELEHEYSIRIEHALPKNPDNRFLRLLRTRLFANAGHHDECFPDLYYLLSLDPIHPLTLYGLADALLALKRYRESLQIYLRIARVTGSDCLLLNQIGACYRLMSQFRSAEKAFWRSIRLNPLDSTIVSNLGEISFRLGHHKRALELYSIALNINPHHRKAFYNKMLAFSVGSPNDMATMRKEAVIYWKTHREAHSMKPFKSARIVTTAAAIKAPPSITSRKIRAGILSADIGNHCVSYFLCSFLKHYNRERFHIELILCDRRHEDREREICAYADYAYSIDGMHQGKAREMIRDCHYDLIIECNGYTSGSGISLLAGRCAPVQCHYIGYHASTGLDTIDYFISDNHILSPSVERQLSEKPLKLNRAWLAFNKFEEFPQASSTATVDRPVLGFFGNSAKITEATLEFWSALFQQSPRAILALKCLSFSDKYIVRNVLARIEATGIDRSRIAIFGPTASWKDHLAYYNLVDYALDSTFWSSATTGFDALGMGVPLLAIQGDTIASRMSSSLVTHLGRPEWLSTTPADYARLGQSIDSEFMQVRQKKKDLQAEVLNSSLFDGADLARSLEKALMRIL